MGQFLCFLKGYVRLRLHGREPERFLNLCGSRGIRFWNLSPRAGAYELNISLKDFFYLQPAARKSGSRVRILGKYGMPFFFQRHRKRKAFFSGIFLCAFLILLLSRHIWNIHVEGNSRNSTGAILDFLESEGIFHGISKSKVDCPQIAASIREEFSNVIWVSARIRGTRLLIEIKENSDGYADAEEVSPGGARDLVSRKDGIVESIITRSGVPLAEPGDICRAGDVLVSGQVPIKNDSGEIIRYEPVQADADIVIRWTSYYYDEFTRQYTRRTYLEEEKTLPFIEFFGWRLDFFSEEENCDYISAENQVFLTENFALPIRYGTVTARPYTDQTAQYSEEKAEELARERLSAHMANLEKTGVEILENHVKIEISDTNCQSSGTLTVRSESVKEASSAPAEADTGKEEAE